MRRENAFSSPEAFVTFLGAALAAGITTRVVYQLWVDDWIKSNKQGITHLFDLGWLFGSPSKAAAANIEVEGYDYKYYY